LGGAPFEEFQRAAEALRELRAQGLVTSGHRDGSGKRRRSDTLGLELRSLVGVLFFFSHGANVPQRDIDAGRMTVERSASGEPFDWQPVVGDPIRIGQVRIRLYPVT
jgi:hypothetical protein